MRIRDANSHPHLPAPCLLPYLQPSGQQWARKGCQASGLAARLPQTDGVWGAVGLPPPRHQIDPVLVIYGNKGNAECLVPVTWEGTAPREVTRFGDKARAQPPLAKTRPPAPFMAGNTSAPCHPGQLCQRPPLPSAGTGGGHSHVLLPLTAFESLGMGPGASREGAATPDTGWGQGQGHSPRGCWLPLPGLQLPVGRSRAKAGPGAGSATISPGKGSGRGRQAGILQREHWGKKESGVPCLVESLVPSMRCPMAAV